MNDPIAVLKNAELLYSPEQVQGAIQKIAEEIRQTLKDSDPLVLSIMGGAVVFSGQLLPLLDFPLHFDFVKASRYHSQTQGQQLVWKVMPGDDVKGRTVLLLDDILDEGITLAAVRDKCLEMGASRVLVAVLTEKLLDHPKPIQADYVGLQVPNRYVFGCGMDVNERWRNLPAIYALKQS